MKIKYNIALSLSLAALVFTLPGTALATDSVITQLTGTVSNSAASGYSNLSISFEHGSTLTNGSSFTIAITDKTADSGSTDITSTASFAEIGSLSGVLSSNLSVGSSSHPSQLTLNVTSDITTGAPKTFSVPNVKNPTAAGCYYVAITTDSLPTASSNWTFVSTPLTIDTDIPSCSGGDGGGGGEEGGGGGVGDVAAVGTVLSDTSISLDWVPVTSATSYGYIYDTSLDSLWARGAAAGSGNSAVLNASGITSTDAIVTGLTPSTTYYFSVLAYAGDAVIAYSQTAVSATTNAQAAPVSSYTVSQKLLIPGSKGGVYAKAKRGSIVQYRITITNTGTTTLKTIPVESWYDNKYLRYKTSSRTPKDGKNDGIITWKNIAPSGGLAPGQKITVTIKYVVREVPKDTKKRTMKNRAKVSGVKNTSNAVLQTVTNNNTSLKLK